MQRHAEREHVDAAVDLSAVLLGSHVRRRAELLPGRGEPVDERRVLALAFVELDDVVGAGEPEVGDARLAELVDEHVVGLEVAVDHPDGVRRREPAGGGHEDREDLALRAPALRQPAPQRGAIDVLHRDIELVAVVARIEHGHHVAMAQPRHGLALAHEPSTRAVVRADPRWQQLDRDHALEHVVARAIDHAHATAAQLAFEAVAAGQRAGLVRELHGARDQPSTVVAQLEVGDHRRALAIVERVRERPRERLVVDAIVAVHRAPAASTVASHSGSVCNSRATETSSWLCTSSAMSAATAGSTPSATASRSRAPSRISSRARPSQRAAVARCTP